MSASVSAERFYYLPLTASCLADCGICDMLGCVSRADRQELEIKRILRKAKRAEFTAVVFPGGLLSRSDAADVIRWTRSHGLQAFLQLDASIVTPALCERILSVFQGKPSLNLVLARKLPRLDILRFCEKACAQLDYTVIPRQDAMTLEMLRQLPSSVRERVRFHAVPFHSKDPWRMTVREAHRFFQRAKRRFPEITLDPPRGPRGQEVWDDRIPTDLGLEPDLEPAFAFRVLGSAPEVSVVIPSYNSGKVLKNVIRHLLSQTLRREQFEIIVIDDGSTDGTEELIRNFVAPEASQLNFAYVRFPRRRERRMGDNHFRAGIARNLGVKHARGRLLCFLDADIVVSDDHLEDLIEKHKRWDVIQCVRLHLKDESRNEFVRYESVDRERETYILEADYWKPFFEARDWHALPFFWKYTCTYGLSLSAEHFKQAGWFRRTFVHYGFEDTDLGYRLARQGRRFFMNPTVTYHLSQGSDRSEYRNSNFERQLLLAKTAKVFYLNNLDPKIYEHFRNFMGGERGPLLWYKRLRCAGKGVSP